MADLQPPPQPISPALALDLRIRFLESLVSPSSSSSAPPPAPPTPLARRISTLGTALEHALDAPSSTDALRRFVRNCTSPSLPRSPPPPLSPSPDLG